ncbi:cobyrinate a,c-diamide synthase [Paraburkholderia gardini]|uniref:Cobyrinate a,c-diamide synthase n=1 Tax=Paraburkholderia gardini TaxID=2823469 RepID=A0ABM8U124_9BURK|nr:cobyrinate a,c-diamide synthase [Paraburkholderia gardini]CAG4893233.1 Hydrogenobyrinate a,c-diamide synthase [Paraburkholderia gardini]
MSACPALFISAPASGQGKTTITAGLARHHAQLGRRVRVFKTGPDFLDPMILARASGAPVQSLDLWMVGEHACRVLLAEAAEDADLILIEGVMGLFDGTPSSADLATTFNVPVVGVISAKAMAQTFGAVAFGLAHFRPHVPFQGVFANRVGSTRHAQMLEEALPDGLRWMGHIASASDIELPDRHLGLHQADEIADLDARIDRAADALAGTPLAGLPAPVDFGTASRETMPRLLDGMRIAIARDAAFSFIYPANVTLLEKLGASVTYFSPLADEPVPAAADALWLPGGYPELHAPTLSRNTVSAASIHAHARAGKTLIAECGGMLYLLDTLTDVSGTRTPMLGLLPGDATMQSRLASLGMQQITGTRGAMRGHTFHYSRLETTMTPLTKAVRAQSTAPGEAVFRAGNIVATYMHSYWPSNPAFTAALFHGEAF